MSKQNIESLSEAVKMLDDMQNGTAQVTQKNLSKTKNFVKSVLDDLKQKKFEEEN